MSRFRVLFLQIATALLYMGPLVAGLGGFGWAMLPPFVSIFVLWLVLLRPHQWPMTLADWRSGVGVGAALTQILSQILLVTVLFGVGRGIGGVLGTLPVMFPMLPVAMSFLALPLMRLAWNPDRALAEGVTIDALMEAARLPIGVNPLARDPARAAAALLALPDDAAPETVLGLLEQSAVPGKGWPSAAGLATALAKAPATRHAALRKALVLWGTDPALLAAGSAPGALRAAFAAAGRDDGLLADLLPRATALARALPDRLDQFPDALALRTLAQELGGDRAAELSALADLLPATPARGTSRAA
ncbi:hypothetical protein [Fuscovulum blasticum]|uniref:hypothetical protein n=1 Tax=Fuscovulum blasticum TaxID=1075 RepID=UPI000D3E8119|nr:hypothetical protein [Fuscovulum blasticum]AWD22603.1 hypothetical protein B6K69_13750 [Fuscovulum blasticum]